MEATLEQLLGLEPAADVVALRHKAIGSLTLAIELFNRPSEHARAEAVLILMHHSFEMLLKSVIVDCTGTAFDPERGYSYQFDTCLRIAHEELKVIEDGHGRFLSILDNLRDSATHYYQTVSEDMLYIFAQASVSLFDHLYRQAAGASLATVLPSRVLPICGRPPRDLQVIVDEEFKSLREMIRDPRVNKEATIAAIRPLLAFSLGAEGQHRRITPNEVEVAIENLRSAENWAVVFPEIAKLRFATEGEGINVLFKVANSDPTAMPVRILKPGDTEQPQGTIIQREINLFDKFNMGLYQLAAKLGLSAPRTLAMIREYKIQDDPEAYRLLPTRTQKIQGYSKRALDMLRGKLNTAEECWKRQRKALTGRKAKEKGT